MRNSLSLFLIFLTITAASCKSEKKNDPYVATAARGAILPAAADSVVAETTAPPAADTSSSTPMPSTVDGSVTPAPALVSFCPSKRSFSFLNGVFLSNISSLQYSHYKFAGPEMERLGFGDKGDGDRFYKAWIIHRIKLINEKTKSVDDTWADEATRVTVLANVKKIYSDLYGSAYVDDGTTSGEFEESIIRTPNNSKLQFISGVTDSILGASSQVMYAENSAENYSIIAFRGTQKDQVSDIVADLNIGYTPLDGMGKAHAGFSSALGEVENSLITILKNRSALAPVNLWITGHSLGGALSTLLTAKIMLLHEKGELTNVNLLGAYSYGSPRVGNKDFATIFDQMAQKQGVTVVRVRNNADPVTMVPVGLSSGGGYWHVGAMGYIDGSQNTFFRDGWVEIETKSDYLSNYGVNASNHSISGYWAGLKKSFETNADTEVSNCTLLTPNSPPKPFYELKELRK